MAHACLLLSVHVSCSHGTQTPESPLQSMTFSVLTLEVQVQGASRWGFSQGLSSCLAQSSLVAASSTQAMPPVPLSHPNTGQTGSPPPNHLVPKLIFKYGYILKYQMAALARPFLACFICLPVGHASSSLLCQSNPQFLQFPVSFPLKNLKSYEKHLNIKLTFISTMCPGLGRRPCPHLFHQQLSVALT